MTDMRLVSKEYEDYLIAFLGQYQAPEAALILKVHEEAGEVAEAFLSFSHNGATAWEVCMELADVAMTAMLAMVSLGYGPDQMLRAQMEKTQERMKEISDKST